MRRPLLALSAAALAAALLTGCGSGRTANVAASPPAPGAASAPSPSRASGALTDLRSIDQLRALFNAHPGTPRLIVLTSPT